MFKFTIREIVMLTVIVALGLAWWLDHSRQAKQNESLLRSTHKWEEATNTLVRKVFELSDKHELLFIEDNNASITHIEVVDPSGEKWSLGPDPTNRRLFRLIAAIEAHGFRVMFKPGPPGYRRGDEELSLQPPKEATQP